MSNVIDLDAFRKKRTAPVQLEPLPSIPIHPRISGMSMKMHSILPPGCVDPQFHRDGLQFKFLRMAPPGAFAILNTSKLPDPFPPDSPPPMAA